MCPYHSSECVRVDQIIAHFSCFDKVLNWHPVGHCRVRAPGFGAGLVPTSCYPGSSPSSPLAQTTRRNESRMDETPSFSSKGTGAHPGNKQGGMMKSLGKCSQPLHCVLSWGNHKNQSHLNCRLSFISTFQMGSLNPGKEGWKNILIAPHPPLLQI